MAKTVLSCEILQCDGFAKRTIMASGECSLGYDESVRAFVHGQYKVYLSGNRLRYFERLDTCEKRYNYLTKLVNEMPND